MTDHEMLLANVLANPDSDSPRIDFANWLEENGEVERSEFIRVQCALAKSDTWEVSYHRDMLNALREHERELIQSAMAWVPVRGTPTENVGVCDCLPDDRTVQSPTHGTYYFRRGFVETIACSWDWFRQHAAVIRAATPLQVVNLTTDPDVATAAITDPDGQQFIGLRFTDQEKVYDRRVQPYDMVPVMLADRYPRLTFKLLSRRARQDERDFAEATRELERYQRVRQMMREGRPVQFNWDVQLPPANP